MSAKNSIKTLPEAKEELARIADSVIRLQDFVVHFSGVMDQLNEMRGSNGHTQLEIGKISEQRFSRIAEMPFTDRILAIMKDANKPMFQKSLVAEYNRRAWPETKVSLSKAINGALNYLTNRRRLVERTDDGYVLVNVTLSANGSVREGSQTARS
jgi:hypothetical protein